MKIIGIIPARYKSSRFPGKPLADICGKPMIWWVYEQARQAKRLDQVLVATDDERIRAACEALSIPVMMTSDQHPTGQDRMAEVAEKIPADIYMGIMGDEPLISAGDIDALAARMAEEPEISMMMAVCRFDRMPDVHSVSTIKIALSDARRVIYMSRVPIPYPKADTRFDYYKNVGIYAFRSDALAFFLATPKGALERAEEVDLLRLLEHGKYIAAHVLETSTLSVDTPPDLARVIEAVKARGITP